jgi:hypothetical protein
MKYFGDSYDIVKQSLLRWLHPFGGWSVHPMFTEPVPPERATAFANFLGAEIVSTQVLTPATDRSSYFSCAQFCKNLFLDPDTGLRLQRTSLERSPAYIFASGLINLVEMRPDALTLVFDQSLRRGFERPQVEEKLRYLRDHEVFGFAYVSHACFVVVGRDQDLVARASQRLISESKLPEERLLRIGRA